ncbi:MAG: GDSL-type esterase/lipase family protein [Planctomycetota bacterium]
MTLTLTGEAQTLQTASIEDKLSAERAAVATLEGKTIDGTNNTLIVPQSQVTGLTESLSRKSYRGSDFTVLGDSITSTNASTASDSPGHAWHTVLAALSGGRMTWRQGSASGGATVQQIRDTHLPEVLAISPRPALCIVFGGTNNVGSADYDLDSDIAALVQIYDALEAVGIRPVAVLITPRASATDFVPQWNHRVLAIARQRGYDVLDFFSPLVDSADGSLLSEYATDAIHPNNLGHTRLGDKAWSVLSPRFPSRFVHLSGYATDGDDLLGGDGFFLADGNADGRGDGWNGSGNVSIVTEGGLSWQRITWETGDAPGVALLQKINIASGFSDGDTLELSMRMRIVGRDAGESLLSSINVELRDAPSGGAVIGRFGIGANLPDGNYVLAARGVIPAGTLGLRVNIQAEYGALADYYLEVAQVSLRNLTAIGAS